MEDFESPAVEAALGPFGANQIRVHDHIGAFALTIGGEEFQEAS
jgi:hypothetical protein